MQGGERVIRNLRARIRHRRDEGGFAGIRHAQQADVGQHLQLEAQGTAFAFLALGLLARGAVGRGLEVDIAPAALAALGQQLLLAVLGQVGDDLAVDFIDDQGADRQAQEHVFRALAIAIGTTPGFAVLGLVDLGIAEIDQGVDVAVRDRPDRTALAAVAAVGAAEGAELFAAERGAAIPATAGDDFDSGFVDELHDVFALKTKKALPLAEPFLWKACALLASRFYYAAAGITSTYLCDSGPLLTNFTTPSTSANRV